MSSSSVDMMADIERRIACGDAYFAQGEFSLSFDEYNEALKRTGFEFGFGDAEPQFSLHLGDFELSRLRLCCLIKCGWALCQNPGDLMRAFVYSSSAVGLDGGSAAAHCLHGIVCHKLGKVGEATEHMFCAKNLDEKNLVYHYNMALMYAESDFSKSNACRCLVEGVFPGLFEKTQGRFLMAIDSSIEGLYPTDADGLLKLGLKFYVGDGVAQNPQIGAFFILKAAELGDAYAQGVVGFLYKGGHGVDRDVKKAVEWFLKAAEQGGKVGMYCLGMCYYQGLGVVKDEKVAVELFLKAADLGCPDALWALGVCYQMGGGVERDDRRAVSFFKKAAMQEHEEAQYYLGKCYLDGCGIRRNRKKAAEWFLKAANHGYPEAQYCIGQCYEGGVGVEKDLWLAGEWYSKASLQGHAESKKRFLEVTRIQKEIYRGCVQE